MRFFFFFLDTQVKGQRRELLGTDAGCPLRENEQAKPRQHGAPFFKRAWTTESGDNRGRRCGGGGTSGDDLGNGGVCGSSSRPCSVCLHLQERRWTKRSGGAAHPKGGFRWQEGMAGDLRRARDKKKSCLSSAALACHDGMEGSLPTVQRQ